MEWLKQALRHRFDNEQISWDELWLSTAHLLAARSRCSRDRVGAVLVTDDNHVISAAYNGAPPSYPKDTGGPCVEWCERAINTPLGTPGASGYHDCPSTHAELNAIKRAAPVRSGTTRLYVSRVPCPTCGKEIASAYATHHLRQLIVPMTRRVNVQHGDVTASVDFLALCGVAVRFL
jgi:dCMP deaminase